MDRIFIEMFNVEYRLVYGSGVDDVVKEFDIDLRDAGVSRDNAGFCIECVHTDGRWVIVVYVNDKDDALMTERILVHELSHGVSKLMKEAGIVDDEFRSYMLDYLYGKAIVWLRVVMHV